METWIYCALFIIVCYLVLTFVTLYLFRKQEKFVKTLAPGDDVMYNNRPGRIASMDDESVTVIIKVPKMSLQKPKKGI